MINNCVGYRNQVRSQPADIARASALSLSHSPDWAWQKYFILMLFWAAVLSEIGALMIGSKFLVVPFEVRDRWCLIQRVQQQQRDCWLTLLVHKISASEIQIIITMVMGMGYGIALLPFCGMHVRFVMLNSTTLEDIAYGRLRESPFFPCLYPSRKPSDSAKNEPGANRFDMGWKENFKAVFGDNPWLWAVPVFTTKGDGYDWPT